MNAFSKFFISTTICLFLASCTQWELKKIPSETYFNQKWKALAMDDVDVYPSFDICNEMETKVALKRCFEEEVTSTFYNSLSGHDFSVSQKIDDTIYIDFVVNEKGKYCIDTLRLTERIKSEIPLLEIWVHDACEQLPKAYPATKKGIPVKTRFKIPLVFQTDN